MVQGLYQAAHGHNRGFARLPAAVELQARVAGVQHLGLPAAFV
jgi:hypothetical protein